MRDLAVSTVAAIDACEYPDSGKVQIVAGRRGARTLRRMFRTETGVAYYAGERE